MTPQDRAHPACADGFPCSQTASQVSTNRHEQIKGQTKKANQTTVSRGGGASCLFLLRSFSLSSPPFFFSSFPLQWFRLSPHLECCLHDLAIFVVKKQHKPGQAPLVLYSIKTRGVCKCVCVSVCVSVLVCVSLSTSLSLSLDLSLSRPLSLSLDLSLSTSRPLRHLQVQVSRFCLQPKKQPHNIILP